LFSIPKAFSGHIQVIQMNALQSWDRLSPHCEIILFGDEEGIAEAASRCKVRHVPEVLRSQYGTPLLNDLFEKAQDIATHNIMCYVNADIILMSDFIRAVKRVSQWEKPFLLVGRRWDTDFEKLLDFEQSNWEERLRVYVNQRGKLRPPASIDYFVFPKGLYKDMPAIAIGRAFFDNWLLWKAHSLGAWLVDASEVIMAVHQNHDYSHHPGGWKGVYEGPEAKHNIKLAGGWRHGFTISETTYRLTPTRLRRKLLNLNPGLRRHWEVAIWWLREWAHLFLVRTKLYRLLKPIIKVLSAMP
jgi:hypothetical protein